jgi:aldehyde:ferredoxin oxidoreductase
MKAKYGYIGRMLFVNLSEGKTRAEELSDDIARKFIGGYGIGSRVIYGRMKAGVDPLGPENILAFGTGPLTLAGTISTCRFTVMGKSPLTGYWGDANSGGNFAIALRASGYDFVFFEGKAEHPVYLLITNGKSEIKDARHIWGKDTAETEAMILAENPGKDYKVAAIGVAGENRVRVAAVINDKGRAAARSGLGAVMGSKNLKAVACAGFQRPGIFDRDKTKSVVTETIHDLEATPGPMLDVLLNGGTACAMMDHLIHHDVPVKNWAGTTVEHFPREKWEKVGWDGLEKYAVDKYACVDCKIACGGWMDVGEGKYAVKRAHKPEYETLAAFGPNLLNDSTESLIYANELCNLYGMDTIGAGGTIALAIDCYENGIITKEDTDGLELTWGNIDAAIGLLHKMARREGIGDILAEGAKIAAEKFGKDAEPLAIHVGGQLIPMHDPRRAAGWGATYVCDPSPATHTRGGTQFPETGMANPDIYEPLGVPLQLDKYNPEGKGKYQAIMSGWQHLMNTSGVCIFAADGLNYRWMELMKAITGWDLNIENLKQTGQRIGTMLHLFNLREGFKLSDFTVPERARGNPPLSAGPTKGVTLDFEGLKHQYFDAMGFDFAAGQFRKEILEELGLQDIATGSAGVSPAKPS